MARPIGSESERGSLGETIAKLRKKAKLTQQKLAEKVGVQQSRIAEIESGLNKSPKIETLCQIAAALEIPPARLLTPRLESVG